MQEPPGGGDARQAFPPVSDTQHFTAEGHSDVVLQIGLQDLVPLPSSTHTLLPPQQSLPHCGALAGQVDWQPTKPLASITQSSP